MSKLHTRASVAGTSLSGPNLKATNLALWDALRTVGVTDSDRLTVTASATLTTTQCGWLEVDCTSGDVTLTLPTSGTATDEAEYRIRRVDTVTANTLEVVADGTDTIEGDTAAVTIGPLQQVDLKLPAGTDDWRVTARGGSSPVAAQAALGGGNLIGVQVITATGTYTPTEGMAFVITKAQGGGGGGGGSSATGASAQSVGGGGASGSFGIGRYTAAQVGASVSVTIGAGGAAGTAGGGNGGTGGTTSFGALLSAPGGGGGVGGASTSGPWGSRGGATGAVSTGGNILNTCGQPGEIGFIVGNYGASGAGAGSPISGGGGGGDRGIGTVTGENGRSYGAGGGGGSSGNSAGSRAGGAGAAGVVVVLEFS